MAREGEGRRADGRPPEPPRTLAKLAPPDVEDGVCEALAASAIAFSASHGVAVERVMTDNGPGYRSRLFNESLGPAASGASTRGPTAPGRTAGSGA